MDLICSTYFNKFLKEQNIEGDKTNINFEKFINYIVLSPKNIANFNLSSVHVGKGDDAGIDGMAIALNSRFMSNIAELKTYLKTNMEFTVEFYYIQAKTSSAFECKEIGNFGDGVVDTFKEENDVKKKMNDDVIAKCKMIREVIDNYEYTIKRKCNLYYITPGTYVEDDNLLAIKERVIDSIYQLGLFEKKDINIYIQGKDYIRKQFEATKVQNSATFELKSKIEIPYIEKVEKAYFAIMPVKEYLNIIIDSDNRIRRGIFELNVRDFQGIEENRVNQDIEATILSNNKYSFGLLNNGITIVGKFWKPGQGKYTIKNFYIVNGCQTTNVLYENRDKVDDKMWVSVKIVITQDDDIIKSIVKATNNQTEVEKIQILSMDEYQEELESFYDNYLCYKQLYYERRDGQYRGIPNISPIDIVSKEEQMKSFASVFLEQPHIASRFVGKLEDEISRKIFIKDHKPIIYYTAALLNYYIEDYFRNDKIEKTYTKFKYHIQLIISQLVWKDEKRPQFNSGKMTDYCIKLIDKITDKQSFKELMNETKEILNKVININDTEENKTLSTVNSLLRYIDIGLTINELNNVKYFLNNLHLYVAPFDTMKSDGDRRYKFIDRFEELMRFIKKYKMDNKINQINSFDKIKNSINEDDKDSRKCWSLYICNSLDSLRHQLDNIIERSRRYEK